MNSTSEGRSCRPIATTASAAARAVGKVATSVAAGGGEGTSRRVTLVTIPSVPPDPTKSLIRDRPATSLILLPPNVIVARRRARRRGRGRSRSSRRISRSTGHRRWSRCCPDRADLAELRVRRIPETVLTGGLLHGGVERARLDNGRARGRVDLDPRHPVEADREPALDGVGAAGQAVPAPRGTMGMPRRAAQRTAACTCATSRGRTTAHGIPAPG